MAVPKQNYTTEKQSPDDLIEAYDMFSETKVDSHMAENTGRLYLGVP